MKKQKQFCKGLAMLLAVLMVLSAVPVASAQTPERAVRAMLKEAAAPADTASTLDSYNIVWQTQSGDSSGSMPVGGHDAA